MSERRGFRAYRRDFLLFAGGQVARQTRQDQQSANSDPEGVLEYRPSPMFLFLRSSLFIEALKYPKVAKRSLINNHQNQITGCICLCCNGPLK
jgi:hypothetical protein